MFLKRMIQSTLIAGSLAALSIHAFASCELDELQMQHEIAKWDSITTQNGVQVQKVAQARESSLSNCIAQGVSFGYPITLSWTKGNWGNTLYARF